MYPSAAGGGGTFSPLKRSPRRSTGLRYGTHWGCLPSPALLKETNQEASRGLFFFPSLGRNPGPADGLFVQKDERTVGESRDTSLANEERGSPFGEEEEAEKD